MNCSPKWEILLDEQSYGEANAIATKWKWGLEIDTYGIFYTMDGVWFISIGGMGMRISAFYRKHTQWTWAWKFG